MAYLLEQGGFVLRVRYAAGLRGWLRKRWYTLLGMKIGSGTILPALDVTWPNQVEIGHNCTLEHHIYFKFDGIWQPGRAIRIGNNVFLGTGCEFNISQGIEIGDGALIASGCRFIDHNHGMLIGTPMRTQPGAQQAIKLGSDVWLGCNVVVLKGVEIGSGAIVAAGAVVTKSILSNEIWAGVPARKIGQRNL
jgi:acetyltransferase-like isoleucine patch superfamily enzyme